MYEKKRFAIHYNDNMLDGYNAAIDTVIEALQTSTSVDDALDKMITELMHGYRMQEAYVDDMFGRDDYEYYRYYCRLLQKLKSDISFADLHINGYLVCADFLTDICETMDYIVSCWN